MNDVISTAAPAPDIEWEPEAVTLQFGDPRTEALFETLSSDGGRRIVEVLATEPLHPARIADRADTSVQNVQYHLSRLEAAGFVHVVGTRISVKGCEMDVYALAGDPIVVKAGDTTVVVLTG